MLATPSLTAPGIEVPRKIWTRKDAQMLVDSGFPNHEKLELINGDLIDTTGKQWPHTFWQNLILLWLHATFGSEYAQMEPSIDVSAKDNPINEPEPDLIVTDKSIRQFTTNPVPADLLLVIEVSDSTVQFDLKVKGPLYARAEIPEYWVIDIPEKLVHVHRLPTNGIYQNIRKYGFQEDIRPLAKPEAIFCASKL